MLAILVLRQALLLADWRQLKNHVLMVKTGHSGKKNSCSLMFFYHVRFTKPPRRLIMFLNVFQSSRRFSSKNKETTGFRWFTMYVLIREKYLSVCYFASSNVFKVSSANNNSSTLTLAHDDNKTLNCLSPVNILLKLFSKASFHFS